MWTAVVDQLSVLCMQMIKSHIKQSLDSFMSMFASVTICLCAGELGGIWKKHSVSTEG
jgi:hypothetical protein